MDRLPPNLARTSQIGSFMHAKRRMQRRAPWALAAAGTLLAGPAAADSKPVLPDEAIETEVESELLLDPAIDYPDLEVEVVDGVAEISGRADSVGEKRRAAILASTVRGVRSVVNRSTIPPQPDSSGDQLGARVESALLRNPATESFEIDVDAEDDGTITLGGEVDSWSERVLARRVAGHVDGVTAVREQLEIEIVTGRPDEEIEDEIRQIWKWDAMVDENTLTVDVREGVAHLRGVVGSAAERSEAVYDAYVRGVTRVDETGIEVTSWAAGDDQRRPATVEVSDSEIRDAMRRALKRDPRVDPDHVEVSVEDGVVRMRGTVHSVPAQRAAAAIARRTTGVLAVSENLTVDLAEPRPDAEVEADIEQALAASPVVDSPELEVEVSDGAVTLTGLADSDYERFRASEVVENVRGVRRVFNRIDVEEREGLTYEPYADDTYVYDHAWYEQPPATNTLSDVEIAKEIRDELWWSPFVDSEDVAIVVNDGIATLTGTVDSWTERQSATENAYEGGAAWVDNDLAVR